ncbi:MAG: UDP-N-acetylmuramoyl-L-alanine--D-glutamate ligase [Alphaproteobacteria bacterium]|nr:UDP-N-acetylmuramoyl-L-alanine--D-glutamate ligase [Alphaproteobacteria bacterium]
MTDCFEFKNFSFDERTGVLSLEYVYKDEKFCEEIVFPNAPFSLSKQRRKALNQAFLWLHIASGVSYYKAFVPPEMKITSGVLSQSASVFFQKMYINGLGQFAVENALNLQDKIHFPFENTEEELFPEILSERIFVPVGGGKDSCVTMELLKEKTVLPIKAFAVNPVSSIENCITKSGLPSVFVRRKISPRLIELNKTGTVYNGHVPISGIIAFILLACAILYDTAFVAMSCERSANSGNLMQGSLEVNHQWSKSFEFEKEFRKLTEKLVPNFKYFSYLRPFSEMKIASLFAQKCQNYFDVFTSCNGAFKLDEKKRLSHWCGACDKCRFVFLMLAPFMEKNILTGSIGTNPLDDETQEKGYRELLGLEGHKPFECVGEEEECRLAFLMLSEKKEWQNDALIKTLAPLLKNLDKTALEKEVMTDSKQHLIPPMFGRTAILGTKGKEGQAVLDYFKDKDKNVLSVPEFDVLPEVDFVFKSPGISLYHPEIQKALKEGIPVLSSTQYFLDNNAIPTVAVTGTKGKSTTSSLLAHLLKAKGKNVLYGGNIGKPLISLLGKRADIIVMELSSYQCADLKKGAEWTILTNLYPENLDWHKTHERYYEDKVNLLKARKKGRKAFINRQNEKSVQMTVNMPDIAFFNDKEGFHIENGFICDGKKKLFGLSEITSLKGEHNAENICAVLSVLKDMKISLKDIVKDINTFKALPHRLQVVSQKGNVVFVDDSISTTPETAVAALKAFDGEKTALLVGGYERGQDYGCLLDYVKNRSDVALVTLPDTGNRVYQSAKAEGLNVFKATTMAEGVALAKAYIGERGVVLLSPGAPSYNLYTNFEERGADFQKQI